MAPSKNFSTYGQGSAYGQGFSKYGLLLCSSKSTRFVLGTLLLGLLVLPMISSVTWGVRCHITGDCSSASLLLPLCLFQSRSGPGSTLEQLSKNGEVDGMDKWKAFLRTMASYSRTVHQKKVWKSHDVSQTPVFESYPPEAWEPWEIPKRYLRNFPNPDSSRLDPSLFHLHIKFLTFDRVNTTLRCLTSLLNANYEGDVISLEVFLDHPYHLTDGWREHNKSMQELALEKRRNMLQVLDAFPWPHGPKKIFTRSLNAGIQPQWMEAFWPENVNEFAFVVEDDTEVSPYYYAYLKRLIMHYYYTKANFNPRAYGISFQRQWFVPAKDGNKLVSPLEPFLYQLVGTWGQILFPIPWKDYHVWYDTSRYTPGLEPILDNMVTTTFWYKKGNSIWTHWQVHWSYVEHMFNLYTGFPGNLSLSVCHRTAGVNIKRTLGPDTEMITRDLLFDPRIPSEERDAVTGLPNWWTNMPAMKDLKLFDFCFREIPNWSTPITNFEELKRVLPIFIATKELAILIVPTSSAFAYKMVRNWLCHLDGTGLHNYMLLFTLHPLKDKEGFECTGAAQLNTDMLEMAEELAERNHLVYVQTDLVTSTSHTCVDMTDSLFLSRHQASLVQSLLDTGLNALVMGVGAVWRMDPFQCFREAASRHRIAALARILKITPQFSEQGVARNMTVPYAGSVVWVEGSSKGAKKWLAFQKLWDKYSVSNTSGLTPEAVPDALKIFHGLAISAPKVLSTLATRECVVAAPWKKAAGAPNSTSPAIVLAPEEDTIANLKKLGLWQLHDVYNSCTAIRCSPYV